MLAVVFSLLTACLPEAGRQAHAVNEQALAVRSALSELSAMHMQPLSEQTDSSHRLVTLSSARAFAFMPDREVATEETWFQEPTLYGIETCDHCAISSRYGVRRDPVRAARMRHHHGVDIRAPQGSPVRAFKGGVVLRADRYGAYGLIVEIRQYDGLVARYAHLNKILVSKGAEVDAGVQVGEVGRTGRTTGAHLHFELIRNGDSLNPMKFLARPEQVVQCRMQTAHAAKKSSPSS